MTLFSNIILGHSLSVVDKSPAASIFDKVSQQFQDKHHGKCKAQPVNALANITLGDDDDGTTDDDIKVLGDLLVEELPQDFDAEVRGGSSNLPQNPSTSPSR
ncbi:hypothetical protein Hamer_G016242 [Homarus americanus]|uniref:Uncharacterized protein n=1 Tax=Homarus americanus TaxID=6706 RepID=A0A8J5JSD9_HOMAM|nr:hypothetical protein Hamer_G016242 [Homarus americanus]